MPPSDAPRGGLLRRTSESGVRPVELLFDLVYVLAVTQLTHYLLEHLSWRGAERATRLGMTARSGFGGMIVHNRESALW